MSPEPSPLLPSCEVKPSHQKHQEEINQAWSPKATKTPFLFPTNPSFFLSFSLPHVSL